MLPLAPSVCQRIRVSAKPRFAVLVSVGWIVRLELGGVAVPTTVQSTPLLVEMETVMVL